MENKDDLDKIKDKTCDVVDNLGNNVKSATIEMIGIAAEYTKHFVSEKFDVVKSKIKSRIKKENSR